jgi:hypothetical protein
MKSSLQIQISLSDAEAFKHICTKLLNIYRPFYSKLFLFPISNLTVVPERIDLFRFEVKRAMLTLHGTVEKIYPWFCDPEMLTLHATVEKQIPVM